MRSASYTTAPHKLAEPCKNSPCRPPSPAAVGRTTRASGPLQPIRDEKENQMQTEQPESLGEKEGEDTIDDSGELKQEEGGGAGEERHDEEE